MKTGIATLPLHYGRAPGWLFEKMVRLSRVIREAFLMEYTPDDFLKRLSDPFWFQAFGCVLGFDWHSSGITTTLMGALKASTLHQDLPIYICGGKGKMAINTPYEIMDICNKIGCDADMLIYNSKMSAKVDSSAVQDGFQIYHHTIVFTSNSNWAVVQQGMEVQSRMARRYHWYGGDVKDFVNEPHSGIISDKKTLTLNLVSKDSSGTREVSAMLSREAPEKVVNLFKEVKHLTMPERHQIFTTDIRPENLKKALLRTYNAQPESFEKLLSVKNVGAKTLRALSLISQLIFGEPPSFNDPALFSFAHGGKDGYPYPVQKDTYENSIQYLHNAVKKAKMGNREKYNGLKRLERFLNYGTDRE